MIYNVIFRITKFDVKPANIHTFLGLATLMFLLLPTVFANPVAAEARTALVIGNANYQNGPLRNPVNDARAMANSLKKLGFKVLLRENLRREGMHRSIGEFNTLLKDGGVGLFYYAGHGMQINGKNFLIPVDADIQHEDDIAFRSIDANIVLKRMQEANVRVNLMVLDACRNNPFARNTRSLNLGLAQMDAPKGTLIAFSTAPGSLAIDGAGKNSVYTRHLLDKLSLPSLPVEQLFKEVRIGVIHETGDKQIPWETSSLTGNFYFVPPDLTPKPVLAKNAQPEKQQVANLAARSELIVQQQTAAALLTPAEIKRDKPVIVGRNYDREGYEIEMRASKLTADELPAMQAAAERGDAVAQTTLGWAYLLGKGQLDGRGIPRSNTKLLKWSKAAARQGYPVAQNNLGVIYQEGIGVKIDYPQAQRYFKLAAEQGYLIAQRNLMDVNTLLTGQPGTELIKEMIPNLQKQAKQPVH